MAVFSSFSLILAIFPPQPFLASRGQQRGGEGGVNQPSRGLEHPLWLKMLSLLCCCPRLPTAIVADYPPTPPFVQAALGVGSVNSHNLDFGCHMMYYSESQGAN